MHTFAQNGFGGPAIRGVFELGGEMGLHGMLLRKVVLLTQYLHVGKHAATVKNTGGVELLL